MRENPSSLREAGIRPLARQAVGHGQAARLHALGLRRLRGGRRLLGHDVGVVGRALAAHVGALPSRPMPRSDRMMNSPMLATIAESAMLKIAGKPQTWMKSTTWPIAESRLAEQPVGEVAERAAQHQPEHAGPAERPDAAARSRR